jgi:hypothetical protein
MVLWQTDPATSVLVAAPQSKANDLYGAIKSSIEKSVANSPAIGNRLRDPLQHSLKLGAEALQLTHEQIVKPEQLSFSAPEYFAKVTDAIDAQLKVYDAVVTELDVLFAMGEI